MSETTVSMPISALIGDDIITVGPDATVGEIAQVLTDADVGAALVGEVGDVVGIVSERDIVRVVAARGDTDTVTAREIASKELIRCDAESTVAEVALEMLEQYVRHVVVLDAGAPVGIVSARDLLGVYSGDDLVDEEETTVVS